MARKSPNAPTEGSPRWGKTPDPQVEKVGHGAKKWEIKRVKASNHFGSAVWNTGVAGPETDWVEVIELSALTSVKERLDELARGNKPGSNSLSTSYAYECGCGDAFREARDLLADLLGEGE